jgi:chemotaxis signal transduction protein
MTETINKLTSIIDRMWSVTTLIAMTAAPLGRDGMHVAILSDELRRMANALAAVKDKAPDEYNPKDIQMISCQLDIIMLNGAIEAHRLAERGTQVAVCMDEVRNFALMLQAIAQQTEQPWDTPLRTEADNHNDPYWPKTPMTSINQTHPFMCFSIGGHYIVENLDFVLEVAPSVVLDYLKRLHDSYESYTTVKWRKKNLPVLDLPQLLGKSLESPNFIFIRTPWALTDQTYAIAVEHIFGMSMFPISKPVPPPAGHPLTPYVRECWENENGPHIFFMDWSKMA